MASPSIVPLIDTGVPNRPIYRGRSNPTLNLPPSPLSQKTKDAIITGLKEFAALGLDTVIKAADAKTPEELERLHKAQSDALYADAENTKTGVASTIGLAGAVVNVVPVIGQIVGAVLAVLAAIIKAVPVARADADLDFPMRDRVKWFTYRGFSRYFWLLQHPTDMQRGVGGGPESRKEHEDLVDATLTRLSEYIGFDVFPYFPQGDYGPAVRRDSQKTAAFDAYGDNSKAQFLVEVFTNLPELKAQSKTTAETDKNVDSPLYQLVHQKVAEENSVIIPDLTAPENQKYLIYGAALLFLGVMITRK